MNDVRIRRYMEQPVQLFMDASGHETVGHNEPDSWRTWVIINSKEDHLYDKSPLVALPSMGIPLEKWSGYSKSKSRGRRNSIGRIDHYQKQFCKAISRYDSMNYLIYAWSFCGSHLFNRKRTILDNFYLREQTSENIRGFRTIESNRGRPQTEVYINERFSFSLIDGKLLVIMELVRHVLTLHKTIMENGRHLFEKPDDIQVRLCSDPLFGDGRDDPNRPHGSLINRLLQMYAPGRISMAYPTQKNVFNGDLIADNIAGLLNDAVENNFKGEHREHIEALRTRSNDAGLFWHIYGDEPLNDFDINNNKPPP